MWKSSHKAGYPLKEREGQASGKWVLMDFGDVIIHVFDRENRLFYNLERIWKDGKKFLQKNYKLYKSEIKTFSENGNRRVVSIQ